MSFPATTAGVAMDQDGNSVLGNIIGLNAAARQHWATGTDGVLISDGNGSTSAAQPPLLVCYFREWRPGVDIFGCKPAARQHVSKAFHRRTPQAQTKYIDAQASIPEITLRAVVV